MTHEQAMSSPSATPLTMPNRGRYAGQVMDISSRRSIEFRGEFGPPPFAADQTDVVLDYFYHEGTFWRAKVPLDGIAAILGQAFNFSKARTKAGPKGREIIYDPSGLPKPRIPILNHVQCRFQLKSGYALDLFPLNSDPRGEPTHRITDFVYSVEAVGPLGVGFNFRDGLGGNLISAHRFLSTTEMVFERIVVENQHVTESPPLPIPDHAKRQLLERALWRSHHAGMTEAYYLYRVCGTNNCTNNPLQILDGVVRYNLAQYLGAALYRFPLSPRFYLRIRGLDADPRIRRMLRMEFTEFIQDAETQARKRDFVRRWAKARRAARDARRT